MKNIKYNRLIISVLVCLGLLQGCASTEELFAQYENHCEYKVINNAGNVLVVIEQGGQPVGEQMLWEPAVYFVYDRSELSQAEMKRLDTNVQVLTAYTDLKLNLRGYTDSIASEEYNQVLAEKRVKNVRNYLESKGIDSSRIIDSPLGERTFVASNDSYANRARNRRVEMVLLNDEGFLLPSTIDVPKQKPYEQPDTISAPGTEKEQNL